MEIIFYFNILFVLFNMSEICPRIECIVLTIFELVNVISFTLFPSIFIFINT